MHAHQYMNEGKAKKEESCGSVKCAQVTERKFKEKSQYGTNYQQTFNCPYMFTVDYQEFTDSQFRFPNMFISKRLKLKFLSNRFFAFSV